LIFGIVPSFEVKVFDMRKASSAPLATKGYNIEAVRSVLVIVAIVDGAGR